MENKKILNKGCKKVKDAGPKPVGTVGTAIEGAPAMPSSFKVEGSAMTMSGTSNKNEVGEVPVLTVRISTEKARRKYVYDKGNFLHQYTNPSPSLKRVLL